MLQERIIAFESRGECSIQQPIGNLRRLQNVNLELSLKKNGTILGKLELTLEKGHTFEELRLYFANSFDLIGLECKGYLSLWKDDL